MNYETLEDELTGLLQGNFFDVKALPEMEASIRPAISKPYVYVMYDTSDFPDPENNYQVVQEEKLKIGFEIHSRTRRGDQGIFAIQRLITRIILGYKPRGCDKLQLVSFVPLQGGTPNHWQYYLQFKTTTHIAEIENDPTETQPLFKTVNIV